MRSSFFATIAVALLCISSSAAAQGAPEQISFQGYVTDPGGTPINHPGVNIRFRLFEGSAQIWRETQQSVKIVDGVFNVRLGSVIPLDTVSFNRPLFLRIKVGSDAEVSPHTQLTSAAYALGMRGLYAVQADEGSHSSYNVIGGASNNVVASGVVGATIGGGGGISFGSPAPNSVLGDFATVGGGYLNTADGFGTVGGGTSNTAASSATVAGGGSNTAAGGGATVGGGAFNTADGSRATVGGGTSNTAAGNDATVGGGSSNRASGAWATVPGGFVNSARGRFSFAAGHRAKADHEGTFVWSDHSVGPNDSLVSTAPRQFLIKAAGGVGINTNQPLNDAKLHVEHGSMGTNDWGFVLSNVFSTNGSTSWRTGMRMSDGGFFEITDKANINSPNFARLDSGGNWTVVSDRRRKTSIEPASDMLQTAMELEPVRYYWKNQKERDGKSLGMIAQQVQEVVPSLVIDGDPMTLNYAGLSVVAIGAIKELYELVQEQQILLAGLQAENEQIRAMMAEVGSR